MVGGKLGDHPGGMLTSHTYTSHPVIFATEASEGNVLQKHVILQQIPALSVERILHDCKMKAETFSRPQNGDVDQGWAILAVCWAFIACALISILLRVWVRWRITRNLGSDDWVIALAMVRFRYIYLTELVVKVNKTI